MNLGEIEFSVFPCKSKSKIPAYYANIKVVSFEYIYVYGILNTLILINSTHAFTWMG